MNDTFSTVSFSICLPSPSLFWEALAFIPFLSYPLNLAGLFYSLYGDRCYLISITLFSVMFCLAAYALQSMFQSQRPFYPECTPPIFYTAYGFPAPEIVSVVSTATSIFFYTVFVERPKHFKARDLMQLSPLPAKRRSVFGILVRIAKIGFALVCMLVYPMLVYAYRICSLQQAVMSTVVSIFCTALFSFVVIKIKHQKSGV